MYVNAKSQSVDGDKKGKMEIALENGYCIQHSENSMNSSTVRLCVEMKDCI